MGVAVKRSIRFRKRPEVQVARGCGFNQVIIKCNSCFMQQEAIGYKHRSFRMGFHPPGLWDPPDALRILSSSQATVNRFTVFWGLLRILKQFSAQVSTHRCVNECVHKPVALLNKLYTPKTVHTDTPTHREKRACGHHLT